jgi:phosphoglycolate phosphatase
MPDAIFFDLDGTLTDPKLGITRSIRHALERMNVAAPPEDELTWCIGPPLRPSLVKLVGEATADKALAHYRERFSTVGLYENSIYPGIPELLSSLEGKRLFLATNKPAVFARPILEHFGIARFFEQIFGPDLHETATGKGDLISHAMIQTGLKATDAVMVGDRKDDMMAARQNCMTGLGVAYGYGGEAELREAGAAAIFATVEDLRRGLLGVTL